MSIPDSYSFLLNRGFQGFDGLGQQKRQPQAQQAEPQGHQQGGLHRLAGGGL